MAKKHYFYDGCKVLDLGCPTTDDASLIKVTVDYLGKHQVGEEILAYDINIQALVSDMFPIGERVRSILQADVCNFTGTVVGYEYHSNKAICFSDKDKAGSRVRYSYGINEIVLFPVEPTFDFTPGYWYRLNRKDNVMAVESVFNKSDIMLFTEDGKILVRDLTRKGKARRLVLHEIFAIEEIGRL